MRKVVSTFIASLVVAVATATQPAQAAPPLHLQDRAFMTYALEQDLAQIAFSALAAQKATDPAVKEFATRTAEYHRGSRARLEAAAQRLEIKPPAALNPVAMRGEATLNALAGPSFDRAYLSNMAIASFNGTFSARREERHGFDAGLRAEAARQAIDLQRNRREAEKLARTLGFSPAADDAAAAGLTTEDSNFLLYAMHIDMAQRGFAEVAAERSRDPRVQAFAKDLVAYHTRSYEMLEKLASAKGVEPLREVSGISSGTQARMKAMQDGAMLDRTFLNAQAFTSFGAHYRYERQSMHGDDPQVRAVAAKEAWTARRQHWRALRLLNDD